MLVTIIIGILVFGISILICGRLWGLLRDFFHNNYSFFEILFVFIYFLEQAIFILVSYFYSPQNPLWIGLLALIVITTVSIEKVMMDSRIRRISRLLLKKSALFDMSIHERDNILIEYNRLKQEYEELLNANEDMIKTRIKYEEKLNKK